MPARIRPNERLLTFKAGGWVILLAVVLVAAIVVIRVPQILEASRNRAVGDGVNVDSYRFDLSTCLVPRGPIVAAGFSKDGVGVLEYPKMLTVGEAGALHDQLRRDEHMKYLVSSDLVIGVAIGGDARAFPVHLMRWHQIVNDEIGGASVAITYDPLCDSSVVFDRRIGGETLTFGASGLLYNSNLLMYDRRPLPRDESLWCQLQFRAIAGPAAREGKALEMVPADVVRWEDWKERHPDTTVLAPQLDRLEAYKYSYANYYGSDTLKFPVDPQPEPGGLANKAPILAVRAADLWRVYSFATIAEQSRDGVWANRFGTCTVHFSFHANPASSFVKIEPAAEDFAAVRSFWFAWHAQHPASQVWSKEETGADDEQGDSPAGGG